MSAESHEGSSPPGGLSALWARVLGRLRGRSGQRATRFAMGSRALWQEMSRSASWPL